MKLALFDLDGTLLPFDSDHAWGQFTHALGWTDWADFKARNDAYYLQYQAGTLDIHDYVRFATEAMRRQSAQAALQARALFMQNIVQPAIGPAALALVQGHQRLKEGVIIVTATNEFVTRPIADAFGVAELIAVELVHATADAAGANWITGEIKGTPSFRAGKVARVAQWLQAHQLAWQDVELTFYTDSINDLFLLEKVTHPVATNPDEALRAVALGRGWRILELFKAD
jgi:HAD superfamily hydrolase (TIGR01490 family)